MVNLSARPNFIDYAKTIGMFLVVLGHYAGFSGVPYGANPAWYAVHFVGFFHMPLFFLIAGILHKDYYGYEAVKKIYVSIVEPYLLISCVGFVFYLVGMLVCSSFSLVRAGQYLFRILLGGDIPYLGAQGGLYTSPMWFCVALMWIKLIQMIENNYVIWMFCILGVVIMFVGDCLFARMDSALVGLIFYQMGKVYKNRILTICSSRMLLRIGVIVACVAFLVFGWEINADVSNRVFQSIHSVTFGRHPLFFLVTGLAGSLAVLEICSFFPFRLSSIVTVSSGTIVILGIQQVAFMFLMRRIISGPSLFAALSSSLVVMIVGYASILICAQLTPRLLGGRVVRTTVKR